MGAKIDPELLDQLDQKGRSPVQAIVQIREARHPTQIPSAADSELLADKVIKRVAADVGHPAGRINVLRNLATIVVEADPDFVRALIRQPEVISAIPNQSRESPFIPPRGKRPV